MGIWRFQGKGIAVVNSRASMLDWLMLDPKVSVVENSGNRTVMSFRGSWYNAHFAGLN